MATPSLAQILAEYAKRQRAGRGGIFGSRAPQWATTGGGGGLGGAGEGNAAAGTGVTAAEGATSPVSFGQAAAAGLTGLGLSGSPTGALTGFIASVLTQAINAAKGGVVSDPDAPTSLPSATVEIGEPIGPESGDPANSGIDFGGLGAQPGDPANSGIDFGGPSGAPGGEGDGGSDGGGGDGGGWQGGGFINRQNQHGPDTIPIKVSHGEYVLPADVVKYVGKNALNDLLARIHNSKQGYRDGGVIKGYQEGGEVDPSLYEDPNANAYNDPNYEGGYSYDPNSDPYGGGDPYGTSGGSTLGSGAWNWLTSPSGMSLLGRLGATGLGVLGARNQANKFDALTQRYEGFGAPSRARYEASYAPGFTMANDPGYKEALDQAATATLHGLSTQGNPAGSPNAWARSLSDLYSKTAYPALQQYRNQSAATGGYGAFNTAAPGAATAGIGAGSGVYNAVGAGIGDIFNPQPSLMDILKQLKAA